MSSVNPNLNAATPYRNAAGALCARAVAVCIAVALAIVGLPFAEPAGADDPGTPTRGLTVSCADEQGEHNITGLDLTTKYAQIWVPAGASIGGVVTGTARAGNWGWDYGSNLFFEINVLTTDEPGLEVGELYRNWAGDAPAFDDVIPIDNLGLWGGFTNTTGVSQSFDLEFHVGQFKGNGVSWDALINVAGGDGLENPACFGRNTHLGARAGAAEQAGDPVDTASGNLFHSAVDIASVAGLPGLSAVRQYNSRDNRPSSMGKGWTEPYETEVLPASGGAYLHLDDGRFVWFPSDGATGFLQPDAFLGRLSVEPDSTYRVTLNSGEVWDFDATRKIELITSADGATASIARASDTVVTSSAGPALTFHKDGAGLTTSVSSTDGRTISYTYAGGNLASASDADGRTWTYGYDANGYLSSVKDPTNRELLAVTYDAGGRVVAQTTPNGGAELFAYDDATHTTTHTVVATGEQVKYVHNALGDVVSIIDPSSAATSRGVDSLGFWNSAMTRTGVSSSMARDGHGNVTSVTSPGKGTVSATYDAKDRPLTVTDPKSGTTTYSYAGSGNSRIPSKETDAAGKELTRTFSDGLVAAETDADGVTTVYTYDAHRQVASVKVGADPAATYGYTPEGWLERHTSPEGRVTDYTYDNWGRVLTRTAPYVGLAPAPTVTTYDDAGRPLDVTDPTGAIKTLGYDAQGRLASVAEPGKPATTYGYNAAGELTTVVDPTGVVAESHYGPLGRVEWTKDGAGRQTSFSYRPDGQLWKTTAPDTGVTERFYDAAGRPWKVKDPQGRITETLYDGAGRVWKVIAPDGGVTETQYDSVGRVWKVTDPTGRVATSTYTSAGRLKTSKDAANVTTTLTYDAQGRLWKVADPLGNITVRTYWADGMVQSETSPAGLTTTYAYWPSGEVQTVTGPPAAAGVPQVTTTSTWSERGELVAEQVSGRGPKQFSYNPDGTMAWSKDERGNQTSYTYDGAGRMVGRSTPAVGGVESWTYVNGELAAQAAPPTTPGGSGRVTLFTRDAAGRISTVVDPSGRTMTDTFNLAGDLTSRVFTQGAATVGFLYGYDAAGRQNSLAGPEGTYNRTFDLAGRVTSADTHDHRYTQYSYDAGGRRQQLTTPEGLELVYGYDAAGRIEKISPNSTMTDWFTGENGAGADPSKWTRQAVAGGVGAIDANRLRLSTTATAGSSMGVTSTAPQTANSVTTVSFQVASADPANRSRFTVGVRQNAANTQGYRLEFVSDSTTASLVKRVGGVDTVLGTLAIPAAGSEIRTQLEVQGSTVRAKAWSASGSSPSSWGVSVTDTAIVAAGATQLRTDRVGGSNSVSIENYRQRNDQSMALAPFVTNTYNADSQITAETFGAGARANTYTAGALTRQVQTVPGANRTTDVTYDAAGSIATTTVGGVATAYGYDAAGELVSSMPSSGPAMSFSYDGAGRRTTSTAAGVTSTYTYNAASQLTSVSPAGGTATSFTYDAAGRRLSETTGSAVTTNTFDPAGRLTNIAKTNGGAVVTNESRAYRPEGLLRRSNITGPGGAFLRYLKFDWDLEAGLAEVVSTLDGETNYGLVRNNGTATASTRGGRPTLFGVDVFGSVINSTGQNLANATGWDGYGQATGAAATNTATFGYRGGLTILGSTFLRAREYDPETGSFLSVDPLSDVAGTPTNGNPYHYGYNDPINRQDPSGLRPGDGEVEGCERGSWIPGADWVCRHADAITQVLKGIGIAAATVALAPAFPITMAVFGAVQAGVALAEAYYDCRDGWNLRCAVSAGTAAVAVAGGAAAWRGLAWRGAASGVGSAVDDLATAADDLAGSADDVAGAADDAVGVADDAGQAVGDAANGATNSADDAALSAADLAERVGSGKAPLQVTPGETVRTGEFVNDIGPGGTRIEPWEAHYDEYGRMIARTDYNAGNSATGVADVHYHVYEWGPGCTPCEVVKHAPGIYPG